MSELTIEYAIECATGEIRDHSYTDTTSKTHWTYRADTFAAKRDDLERQLGWIDAYFKCGPHRVVSRSCTPWTAVEENEK